MMQRNYETERLTLRTLNTDNAQAVLAYFDRNRAFLEPWEPTRCADFYTKGYQRGVLEAEQTEMDAGRMLKLWLFRRDDPKRVIGSLSFSGITRGSFLSCFMGYRLDEQERGKGYMPEAVLRGTGVMFTEFGLHRIEANVIPRNAASLRVVEKAGFEPEGISRRYLKINGVWEDHVHMVLLNDAM
jgi:ribosomal-protein-alanine N-acetyltransferase